MRRRLVFRGHRILFRGTALETLRIFCPNTLGGDRVGLGATLWRSHSRRVAALVVAMLVFTSCQQDITQPIAPDMPSFSVHGGGGGAGSGVLLATSDFGHLLLVDIDAGTAVFLGAVGTIPGGRKPGWSGISFDPDGDLFVASNRAFERGDPSCSVVKCAFLYNIDPATGAFLDELGSTGFAFLSDIDFSGAILYTNLRDNDTEDPHRGILATIDPVSGAATLVGTRFGFGDLDRDLINGALSVHPVTGDIWVVERTHRPAGPQHRIFRVDPNTGLAIGPTVPLGLDGVPAQFGLDALEILADGRFIGTQARFSSNLYLINPEPDPSTGLANLELIPLDLPPFRGFLNGLESVPPPNAPPEAEAGEDQTVEWSRADGGSVMLDGSGSSDPDQDDLTYSWSEDGNEIGTGVGPTVNLALGTHTITLTVDDGNGETDSDEVVIDVVDTTAPTVTAALVPVPGKSLKSKKGLFTVEFSCSDDCDSDPSTSATMNNIPVENGQVVDLRLKSKKSKRSHKSSRLDKSKKSGKKGKSRRAGPLRIEDVEFKLEVVCVDESGNEGSAIAIPEFAEKSVKSKKKEKSKRGRRWWRWWRR